MSGLGERPAAARPAVLRVVFGATFLVRFAFGLTLAVFSSYLAGTSVGFGSESIGTIGLVAALAPAGEFTTVLATGSLADRRGRFPVLIAAIGGAALVMFLSGLSRNPLWLGPLNVLFGVASGAILTTSLAVVGNEARRGERGHEMGRFDAMNLLGWILGFAVGFGLLGELPNTDLDLLFFLGATILAGGFGAAYRGLDRSAESPRRLRPPRAAELFRAAIRREVLQVTLPWLVIYLLLGTLFVFLGGAAGAAGLAPWVLALLIGGGGLVLLATQPYFGRLADRFGRLRLMEVGTLGFVGVLAGAILLTTYGVQAPGLVLVAVSVLPALAYGPAALAALTDASLSESRATTMAVYTLSISLGMLLGLLVSTNLFDAFGALGLDAYFAGIAVALGALMLWRIRDARRTGPVRPASPGPAPTIPAR